MIYKPELKNVHEYFHRYLNVIQEENLNDAFTNNTKAMLGFLSTIPKDKEEFRYAPGKWTLKEVISHVLDSERIFTYRALRFSRKDKTDLPGYDETLYAPRSNVSSRSMLDLAVEFKAIRSASVSLYDYMTEEMLDFKGVANTFPVNARLLGWITVGHCIHHCRVIEERYL